MDPHMVSMTLAEFCPQIKQLHVALVLASGAFCIRPPELHRVHRRGCRRC